jgi:hypothetical protein
MSTKQAELATNGHADVAHLLDQAMLATMGLANQGVTLMREAAVGVVNVADTFVEGTLDVASSWGKNTPMEPLTNGPVDVVRKTWTVGRDTTSRLLVGAPA